MDAVTPKARHDTLDTHSHVVRPATMEWKKTRFAGCEVNCLSSPDTRAAYTIERDWRVGSSEGSLPTSRPCVGSS